MSNAGWPSASAPAIRQEAHMSDPIQISLTEFASDPHAWLDWLRSELSSGRWEVAAATIVPAAWRNEAGHSWRIVRTTDGVEIRPELESPFIRYGESPKVTALALNATGVAVELTCRSGRWVDRFPPDAFDVAALGRAMLDEKELPHDNLGKLFPLERRRG
jgi:hypothetical protein